MEQEKKRVIFDTNFLMIPGQFKVDIFAQLEKLLTTPCELCVFFTTYAELTKVAEGQTKDRPAARIALQLIKQKNLKILTDSKEKTYLDKVILEHTTIKDIVCTQDQELKRKLKEKSVQIITLKSKKYLGFA